MIETSGWLQNVPCGEPVQKCISRIDLRRNVFMLRDFKTIFKMSMRDSSTAELLHVHVFDLDLNTSRNTHWPAAYLLQMMVIYILDTC